MNSVVYQVPAIHCKHCVHTIHMELSELPGVKSVDADLDSQTVKVDFDAPASEEKIVQTLADINYPIQK